VKAPALRVEIAALSRIQDRLEKMGEWKFSTGIQTIRQAMAQKASRAENLKKRK